MNTSSYFVYILSNKNNTVLYVGVTNNLIRRVSEHKQKLNKGFTSKYNIDKLVYFESYDSITLAIAREKQLKVITRSKKDKLIDTMNPDRLDLYINGKIIFPNN
jgi:putative endonuclease